MTATQIISEIASLDAGAQDEVIHFAVTLAMQRRLSGPELSNLAEQLPDATTDEVMTLRQELERGFYGTAAHA